LSNYLTDKGIMIKKKYARAANCKEVTEYKGKFTVETFRALVEGRM
jgi:hypothetical protein